MAASPEAPGAFRTRAEWLLLGGEDSHGSRELGLGCPQMEELEQATLAPRFLACGKRAVWSVLVLAALASAAVYACLTDFGAGGALSAGDAAAAQEHEAHVAAAVSLEGYPQNPIMQPGGSCYFNYNSQWQHGEPGKRAMCFCKQTLNKGCSNSTWCPCPQGCQGPRTFHPSSVTFRNLAVAHIHNSSCKTPVALLTIPKSYFRDIGHLMSSCPSAAVQLLAEMLWEGFAAYQVQGRPGPVQQCIHSGYKVSVPWLHLHTLCIGGSVDGMYHTGPDAFCHPMHSFEEAWDVARQITLWSQ